MASFSFSDEAKQVIRDKINAFSSGVLIGRLVGFSRIRGSFRDRIRAGFSTSPGVIEDILLLGRGTFMLLLSFEEYASSLLEKSPLSLTDKLIFLVKWYEGILIWLLLRTDVRFPGIRESSLSWNLRVEKYWSLIVISLLHGTKSNFIVMWVQKQIEQQFVGARGNKVAHFGAA